MKKLLSLCLCTSLSLSFALQADEKLMTASKKPIKNVIMIVGDGMGPAFTTAYRYYNDDPNTPEIEETVFDRHLVGLNSTYPAPISGYVTDSAAGATALATGIKSYNGAISVDVDKKPLKTVLQHAKTLGKKTGVVVTSQVNHATPASYITHNESRRNYDAIADSYIDNGINIDLLLGGGTKYFIREDRNLVEEFKEKGFQYVDNYEQLTSIKKEEPLLGLFAPVGLPWSLDDSNKHRLSEMTKIATEQLENKNGYFMLIEASQVDWAGHSNDIASAMAEMDDLAKTLIYLEQYVEQNPDTLVVLTADHSTGGLTLGSDGEYKWQPSVFKGMTQSISAIAQFIAEKEFTAEQLATMLTFALTDEQLSQLHSIKQDESEKITKPQLTRQLYKKLNQFVSAKSFTGWTTGGHTGIDVPVFAFGKGFEKFQNKTDNTDIAKIIFTIL
ncbi:alkaline phosphatase [Thalassotalea profundi]|uniref:Alkaline phosphatase n=1 Tax=Thalassotalea profundi TaxID=2036687 RepID=A0ABQ3IIB0_9GAMM|nr:alkaline phosphatase [Thalassotalea profundi]GHE82351.1 alkaline phosphatase [Thalassotalea profundi]